MWVLSGVRPVSTRSGWGCMGSSLPVRKYGQTTKPPSAISATRRAPPTLVRSIQFSTALLEH
jgi:hypothetical protein